MTRAVRIALLGALVAGMAALPGCGRKAPNLPPADSTYPRTYPAPPAAQAVPPVAPRPAPPTVDDRRRVTAPPS
jgi:hypothetical protein